MGKIGDRIKEKRREKGFTLEKLSSLLGVTTSTISKYEKGAINIPSDKIERLAIIFKCSPAYFMGWAEEKEKIIEKYNLNEYERAEFKKILDMNFLLFNDKDLTLEAKDKLKEALMEVYVETLLEKRKKEEEGR